MKAPQLTPVHALDSTLGTKLRRMSLPSRSQPRYRLLVLAPLMLTLAACSLGPTGQPPAIQQPDHYGVQAQPTQTVEAQGVAQHFDVGAQRPANWWEEYRSPALNALVEEGLKNSPNLAAADKRLAAAREQLSAQVGSSLLPSVDLGGQATRERALGLPMFQPPTALYNLFVGQLQAQYTFDFFGASRMENAAQAARVDEQAFQLTAARRALAANIVTGAISAAALGEQVALTERLVALSQTQAQDAQRRYALSAISRADALAVEQDSATLAASLPGLRTQWLSTRHALAALLGRNPDQAPEDLPFASLRVPEHVPVVVPSELLATRPDIQAAEAALKAAAAEVGVATAQMFPSLQLTASMGKGGFSWPTALSGAGSIWSIGAALSQPLFHGGALLAQRRAAQQNYEAAVAQYKQTVLATFRNVADTLASLEQNNLALAAAETAAQAASSIHADTARRVQLGALAPSQSRASEQQYLNARVNAIQYASARLNDTAALFQAMGTPEASPTEKP